MLLACATTWADFTPVHQPPGKEASVAEILASFYSPGTAWAPTGGRLDDSGNPVDLSNGSLLAARIDDFGFPGVLDMGAPYFGDADDQSWTGASLTFNAVARYAGYTQEFGYDLDGDDAGYTKLFDVRGNKMKVSGSATLELKPGESLAWYRSGNHGGQWSSRTADNSDAYDHMIAYRMSGFGDDLARWMLFWEDLPKGGDLDYNDMAVEVTTVAARVPEPGVGTTMALACGAYVLLRRRNL